MAEKYYKLGEKATIFSDPTQSENKKVLPGKMVPLELNAKVAKAKQFGHLIECDKTEVKEWQEAQAAKTTTDAPADTEGEKAPADQAPAADAKPAAATGAAKTGAAK